MLVEPVHRGILAADIEGFGRLERSNPVRVRLRTALYRLIDQSLAQAGIEPWRCEQTDHGDCVLILLEPQIPKARLLNPFVPRLTAALGRHNRASSAEERLRLRLVIHAGEILRDAHGYSGEDLNQAFRLLDSEPAHTCLAEAPADLAVIVSDAIYQAIVKHGYRRIDPSAYRLVRIVAKETNVEAWVYAPKAPTLTPRPRAARVVTPPSAAEHQGPIPTQLPPDVAAFTGRRRELRRLRGLLATAVRRPAAVLIAIDGIGGIGKSALAVHAAHAVAAQFPDGQLYVDLGGSSAGVGAMAAQDAIGRFLRALGVDGGKVPIRLEEATEQFRSLLAGRRILVLLDNAADATQLEPLLPVAPGPAAVITSRNAMLVLDGAVHLHLDVLPPKESVALLRRLAGDDRVTAEPATAETVAQQCGFLPLALRIAGARLAARPSWPLHALAEQLADERGRLDHLQLGDLAVRASFQLSYQALLDSEDGLLAARVFRLLGLLDGPDISIPVAAALIDKSAATVEAVLERLVDAQMLQSPIPGRYRLHDLLRLFAREQAHRQERPAAQRAALRRALRCYLTTTQRANRLLAPANLRRDVGGNVDGVGLGDRQHAILWLEAERDNLIAAAQQAAAEPERLGAVTVEMAAALFWFLQARGYWRDWRTLNQLALQVTRRLSDRKGQGQALSDLAGAYHRLGQVDEAIACLEESLRICRELGDSAGEQAVLSNLGIVYREAGRFGEAISSSERSLAICRESGDRYGEGMLLNSLGQIYREQRRFDAATTAYANSLRIFQEMGDAYGQGNALLNLGEASWATGRHEKAIDYCVRSLALFREIDDRPDEAESLWWLGNALDALGQREQALARRREAFAIFQAIGSPRAKQIEEHFDFVSIFVTNRTGQVLATSIRKRARRAAALSGCTGGAGTSWLPRRGSRPRRGHPR